MDTCLIANPLDEIIRLIETGKSPSFLPLFALFCPFMALVAYSALVTGGTYKEPSFPRAYLRFGSYSCSSQVLQSSEALHLAISACEIDLRR